MSATTSSFHVGMVLIAVQISFFSASVATVPLKCSLPSRSSALPWNLPLAVWIACAYVSLKPIAHLLIVEHERHHHVHLVLGDARAIAAHLMLFHPRAADIPQCLGRARQALLDCILEAFGRRRADLRYFRYCHRVLLAV